MSVGDQPPQGGMAGEGRPPTEEELRAAYEAEIKRLRVEDVVVQTVVSLINLGARKAGIAPGTEDEADPDQLRQAIDAARALMPFAEPALGPEAGQLRDALSQLQIAYAKAAGGDAAAGERAADRPAAPGQTPPSQQTPRGPGPAQSSGKLWIPGQ